MCFRLVVSYLRTNVVRHVRLVIGVMTAGVARQQGVTVTWPGEGAQLAKQAAKAGPRWDWSGLGWAGLATHRHTLLKRGVCCSYTHTQHTLHMPWDKMFTEAQTHFYNHRWQRTWISEFLNARFSANTLRCTGLILKHILSTYNLIAWCPDSELNINQSILGPHECHSTNAAPAKICCSDDWFMELMSSGHDIILASYDRVYVNKQQFSSSLSVNFKTLQTCYDSLATPLLSIDLLYTLHCTARAPYSHHSHKMTLVSAQCPYSCTMHIHQIKMYYWQIEVDRDLGVSAQHPFLKSKGRDHAFRRLIALPSLLDSI